MKLKVKKVLIEGVKVGLIAVALLLLLAMAPYCRNILYNANYIVVTDDQTACQPITETQDDRVLVEFRCDDNKFPKLLSTFITNHHELEFKFVETIKSESTETAKGFIVTFGKCQ